MERKKSLREIIYALLLLTAIIILFFWYTGENSKRMEERNKEYAWDSARLKAEQIDEELNNSLNIIHTYAYFIEEVLTEPAIKAGTLKEMEENARFDVLLYADADGIDHASDGREADVADQKFYQEGIEGKTGIDIVFDPYFFDEIMVCFYTPVRYQGEVIGVLRGAYLAEEHLQDMLSTTYFGEEAEVFLCVPDGRVIAKTNSKSCEGHLLDGLAETGIIDENTAAGAKGIFEGGGEGVFVCSTDSETDNLCVMYLPENDFILVQAFPKSVTQSMIRAENMVGIRLEIFLIGLFAIYILLLIARAGRRKKLLEQENREMGYIINGVNTLFSRFAMVDFETNTYHYLAGTSPEEEMALTGSYPDLVRYFCAIIIDEKEREEFTTFLQRDSIIEKLDEQNDLRFECHVMQGGSPKWKHMNIICLERKEGRAVKVLFTRQNITEVKERELKIQAEMSLANRKERQYRIAIASNSFCTFEFNLTKDLIEQDITRIMDGHEISLLERAGLTAPCKASECFEKWKAYVLEESIAEYLAAVNIDNLRQHFEQGEAEVDVEYWGRASQDKQMCVRQSFVMTQDDDTGDIMVMVVFICVTV